MSGFFIVTDVPARRVVQYKRVQSAADNAVYLTDDSVLGTAVDAMPFVDKTGITVAVGGTLYEVPYLADAGDVYFATQPKSGSVGDVLIADARAGTAPYAYQWYKDDKQVVNIPATEGKLVASEAGKYWCVVTDGAGASAVSVAAEVTAADS